MIAATSSLFFCICVPLIFTSSATTHTQNVLTAILTVFADFCTQRGQFQHFFHTSHVIWFSCAGNTFEACSLRFFSRALSRWLPLAILQSGCSESFARMKERGCGCAIGMFADRGGVSQGVASRPFRRRRQDINVHFETHSRTYTSFSSQSGLCFRAVLLMCDALSI